MVAMCFIVFSWKHVELDNFRELRVIGPCIHVNKVFLELKSLWLTQQRQDAPPHTQQLLLYL